MGKLINRSLDVVVGRSMLAGLGLSFIVVVVIVAVFAPIFAPYDPLEVNLSASKLPPSAEHPFGTDDLGRDIFSRAIYGARISLAVGFLATGLALLIGFSLGLLSGYVGGVVDRVVMSFTDITLAFPSLLLAIGITIVMPPGLATVFIALGLVGWASFARIIRGLVLELKEKEFVQAARSAGSGGLGIIRRHLLPNCLPTAVVLASLYVGSFMLAEAALSFLGLGVQPPAPTWGGMVNEGRDFLISAPWFSVFPGMAIALTILSFNVVGDTLRTNLAKGASLGGLTDVRKSRKEKELLV